MISVLAFMTTDIVNRDVPKFIEQREKADEIVGMIHHGRWKAKQEIYKLRALRRKK